ncbi:MAG: hypothetical protein M9952_03630 [Microthrixaceae bacterium]|nr:hypothetical protein [Microthrixaceae bacterium]MCO5312011.1 hypothetical protein [Microthrixaceae bacterium]HPB44669.1 hypothetical protein [Microthrixaceae bacterium]
MRSLLSNPLMRLEYLRRFRTATAAWTIPLLAILPIIGVSLIYGVSNTASGFMAFDSMGNEIPTADLNFPTNLQATSQIDIGGVSLLIGTASVLTALLGLLVPAIVGASIAGERQGDTLQPLQLTRIRPIDIVIGKLVGSLGYVLFLLVCLAPILVVPYLAGGLSVSTIALTYLVLVAFAVELGSVSILASSRARRPVTAVIMALIANVALVAGPWIVAGMIEIARFDSGPIEPQVSRVVWLSPITLFSIVGRVGDTELPGWWTTTDQIATVVCWAAVITVSIVLARRGVRAPVDKDR